jgi:hypothetical protein
MEKQEKAKVQIVNLDLPENNLGRIRVLNLNSTRQWNAEKQQSEYKGCWFRKDDYLYEINIQVIIDTDNMQVLSVKPYLRQIEIEGQTE